MDFERDSKDHGLTKENLVKLETLCRKQIELEDRKALLEEQLQEALADLQTVRARDVPMFMKEVGLVSLTLSTGEKVEVKEVVKASIPKEVEILALQWLRENGHESIIKNEIVTKFGKGEEKKAAVLVKTLEQKGYIFSRKEEVHYQTLQAFVRDQLEQGNELPSDRFTVFQYDETKITRKRGQ